jgi:hypothetical protein
MNKPVTFLIAVLTLLVLSFSANAQWTWVGTVTGAGTFPSIFVLDQNTVFACGGPSGVPKVYKSTNGGVNFTELGTSGISLELYCIWATDANTIYVGDGGAAGGAGGNAKVYKTTNGGVSWTTILSTGGSAGFINGIVFSRTTPTFGVIESDPPTGAGLAYWLATTTNGGTNWTVSSAPGITGAASGQNSIVVIDNLYYGFGLNAGATRVCFTSNGGTNWVVSPLGVTGSFIGGYAVSTDKQTVIAASSTSLPNIARSTNGGSSFSTVNTGTGITAYCNMKWVYGTNVCYLTSNTGASGCARKSTDGGLTWVTQTTNSITGITHMELIYVSGTVYAYAVAGDGSVIKLVDNLVGVNNGNTNTPSDYKLEQNYPNPFNPTTTINYSLPKASQVTLKIYDMLGNEVMAVVNEYKNAGNYSASVDASSLASGVYFYKMETGTFKESRKMIVVK